MSDDHKTDNDDIFWALSDDDREALRVGRVLLQQERKRQEIIRRVERFLEWYFDI